MLCVIVGRGGTQYKTPNNNTAVAMAAAAAVSGESWLINLYTTSQQPQHTTPHPYTTILP